MLADKVPAIQNIEDASEKNLKQLGAALASTGMVNMFHSEKLKTEKGLQKIEVEAGDIKKTIEDLSKATSSEPDLIFIGCPHCSLSEIKQIAKLMEGKKVRPGKEFWVCTSRCIKDKAKEHVKEIERSGGHVLAGVCTIVSWTEKLGIKTIMTNSAKTAYYAPTLNKAETILAPLKDCITSRTRATPGAPCPPGS